MDPELLPRDAAVLDLAYRREKTPWVRACLARGLRARDGMHMLIEQGALAFERWFGVTPDRNAMWSAVR
jgi:shikimate dehydrogenase